MKFNSILILCCIITSISYASQVPVLWRQDKPKIKLFINRKKSFALIKKMPRFKVTEEITAKLSPKLDNINDLICVVSNYKKNKDKYQCDEDRLESGYSSFVAALLKNHPTILSLSLYNLNFPDIDSDELLNALLENSSLKHLDIFFKRSNSPCAVPTRSIMKTISSLTNLTHLNVNLNEYYEEESSEYVDAIQVIIENESNSLKALSLIKCASSIASIITTISNVNMPCHITSLNLSHNKLDEQLCPLLTVVAKNLLPLQSLSLQDCDIKSDETLTALHDMTSTNTTVANLNLADNSLKNNGFILLLKGITANKLCSLTTLDIANNEINKDDSAAYEAFLDLFFKNTTLMSLKKSRQAMKKLMSEFKY